MASDANKPRAQTANMNRQIDENLKRAFEATVNEDLPDRFKDLIARLKASDGASSDDR